MISKMTYICDNEYSNFFSYPNVVGVGIGHKVIENVDTDQLCLKVLVKEKIGLDALSKDEIIPKIYDGFMTDVLQVGEFRIHDDPARYRPAPGGCQIKPQGALFVGTFGCLVSNESGTDLRTYILSNNHVLGGVANYPLGTTIVQPIGTLPNAIANLSDYVPIDFTPGAKNLVDAGIAKVIDTSLVTSRILTNGGVLGPSPTGIASAQVGSFVQKRGRTTLYTTGTITAINATVAVNYGTPGVATFIKQIVATPMSDVGDSGSIVLDSQNRVVGLLYAGTAGNSTIMCDIRYVLHAFRARLV